MVILGDKPPWEYSREEFKQLYLDQGVDEGAVEFITGFVWDKKPAPPGVIVD